MFKRLFKKTKYITVSSHNLNEKDSTQEKPLIPDYMWSKCEKCGQIIYSKDLKKNYSICGFCKNHFRISAYDRIQQIIDEDTWEEIDKYLYSVNPLNFKGYDEKVEKTQEKTQLNEAVVTGIGNINGQKAVVCIMDSRFFMGSMGSVVGEKITRAIEKAIENRLPLIIFTASGGARMQEGMFSLMQMAKVSAALSKLSQAGLLYVTVLTDPTTGGVTASFAMLGDIILSEPGALIGFAGKRVIEQTINKKLPHGFQTAEFLMKHGFIDKIVNRKDLKDTLSMILKFHKENYEIKSCDDIIIDSLNISKNKLDAWQKLKLVRNEKRPTALDYINNVFENFIEFHGDRYYGDDPCIVGGIGFLNGMPVTVISQQKGRDLNENIERNFGMPNPEGYRKALRLMKQAEKFNRPIVCFIDTPGAYCGVEAEERGQGEAIAKNLINMISLEVPIISIVIGEGGSGGALALSVSDKIWMLENAVYSLLSPEGFASILWKDAAKAEEAANIMKITSEDLKNYSLIDKILYEPYGDASKDVKFMSDIIKNNLIKEINNLEQLDTIELLNKRYNKFRVIGEYKNKT
ncbi:acetyl-CoA carboxylase carboxyltransferase subunit alpha [Clostridium cochlearium]|uniref:acetyl-CoA carboxylase carboxyltransferase subunit alpha n=1 Tax=Clostridium cochlearium TaxID=1494 RepID=UPI000BBC516B|nr:acetyl-CoA carboxylase carboxyltransferase subunit alpha [Clostridium cochlearium]